MVQSMAAFHLAGRGEEAFTAGAGGILLTAAGAGDARMATLIGIGARVIPGFYGYGYSYPWWGWYGGVGI